MPPRHFDDDIQRLAQRLADPLEPLMAQRLGSGGGGVTDHGALTGLADDDHPQYHNDARGDARYMLLGSGITDHGALTGLGDDDHPQYYNQARGDARYLLITAAVTDHGALTGLSDDDHTQYYNQARGDARYAQLAAVNQFTQPQGIRGAVGSQAAGLYVPAVSGDTLPVIKAGGAVGTIGVQGETSTSRGVSGSASSTGDGVYGAAAGSGAGVVGTNSSTGQALKLTSTNNASNSATRELALMTVAGVSGTPAAGYGASWRLQALSSTLATRDIAIQHVQWTTATDASRSSAYRLQLVEAGVTTDALQVDTLDTADTSNIQVLHNGTLKRVNVGAVDSAGPGQRLVALNNIASGSGTVTGVVPGQGTSFPVSPTTNTPFYRTDLNMWCHWDGTNWLSPEYELSFISRDTMPYAAASGTRVQYLPSNTTYNRKITKVTGFFQVGGTIDASNYWTFAARTDASGTVGSYVTPASTGLVATQFSVSAFTLTTGNIFYLQITATGSPPSMSTACSATFRYVIA